MTPNKKSLPIGIETFAKIRNGDFYYIDKTEYIIELIHQARAIFLARPRCFGKSLTLDTIAELFAGNKTLFTGLYAEHHWDWEKPFPVVQLNLDVKEKLNADEFLAFFNYKIDELEKKHGLAPTNHHYIAIRLPKFIRNYAEKMQQPIVVLVDNYDAVLFPHLLDKPVFEEIFNHIKEIYAVFSSTQQHTRFTMIAGVLRLQVDNLFSAMNQQLDVTLSQNLSSLCGYTQAELERVFALELDKINLVELKKWYYGYNWTGESVYNPCDILQFLQSRQFEAYWFTTSTPEFLLDKSDVEGRNTSNLQQALNMISLPPCNMGDISLTELMFYKGYLTIESLHILQYGIFYTLKFSNFAVQQSFNNNNNLGIKL